ncbi:urea ABC transporter, permease protein UrtB [Paracidovorax avenae ATCC 19860]|uniref:Urea ABC transporter, permease protein UrtB n=1 Tax=Paracidovorax avenae (strain ATCC 19860 / DSM 7227 / CCUG 15838 / JCM 20985 / LMG 2117 / NCPPB 1011) TaxID=643561 RepID=F0QA24_PARA1|nr:urea ABC transporter permease subunit UrtB [Paracidovorax avenae]ADX47284.1 urea ABC transporter, permease protein UrtB [Paracidovorax avenae ATCC 19860]AVS66499.1 urea ABC transporter permease subunit UrtB [Paracidovorax avenae]
MSTTFFHRLIACLLLCAAMQAQALTADAARAMAAGDTDERIAALQQAVATPDEATVAFIRAMADDAVKIAGGRAIVVKDGKGADPVTGAPVSVPDDAEDIVNNNRMRGEFDTALASLQLMSPDVAQRRAAIDALKDESDEARLPLIDKALAAEREPGLKARLEAIRARIQLSASDPAQRQLAAQALAGSGNPATRTVLLEQLRNEQDPKVRAALDSGLKAVEARLQWGERLGALFSGLSLGSILLLVALGLAITYGLMGVINMAHGELMMIGAYATYVVQGLFQKYLPGAFDWYLVAAVPVAFLASALMGAVLERGVIRFLYGRPLETLLATWGISLVLQQLVRSLFGAQNVGVENPAWMSGGVQVLENLQLPWNRLVIVAFAFAVLGGVAFLIGRTRLGLFVRGVTQNRPIASCMGVNTARVDTYAFALGSGIAGLAGCALSQVGNVGPDLGQGYIVDSFMVVVLGGVGQLAGTVYAALGLGVLNKFLESWTGAVLAKIAVLVLIIVFIQKRPQGIFAVKGRTAD